MTRWLWFAISIIAIAWHIILTDVIVMIAPNEITFHEICCICKNGLLSELIQDYFLTWCLVTTFMLSTSVYPDDIL